MESIALKVQFTIMQYILACVSSAVRSETDQGRQEPANSGASLVFFHLMEGKSHQIPI